MNPTPSRLAAGSFLSLSWPGAVPVSTSGAAQPVAPRQVDPAPPECCRRPRRASLEFAMPRRSLPVALLLLAGAVAPGQAPDPSKLTIDRIFEGKDFQGDPVAPPKWLDAA